jgi:hypothetical protein
MASFLPLYQTSSQVSFYHPLYRWDRLLKSGSTHTAQFQLSAPRPWLLGFKTLADCAWGLFPSSHLHGQAWHPSHWLKIFHSWFLDSRDFFFIWAEQFIENILCYILSSFPGNYLVQNEIINYWEKGKSKTDAGQVVLREPFIDFAAYIIKKRDWK